MGVKPMMTTPTAGDFDTLTMEALATSHTGMSVIGIIGTAIAANDV